MHYQLRTQELCFLFSDRTQKAVYTHSLQIVQKLAEFLSLEQVKTLLR